MTFALAVVGNVGQAKLEPPAGIDVRNLPIRQENLALIQHAEADDRFGGLVRSLAAANDLDEL